MARMACLANGGSEREQARQRSTGEDRVLVFFASPTGKGKKGGGEQGAGGRMDGEEGQGYWAD